MGLEEILHVLGCPRCHAGLVHERDDLACMSCDRRYRVDDGIPILVDSMDEGAGRGASYYADPEMVERYYTHRVHTLGRAHYGLEHFPTGGVLVDVGCGPGILTMVAARRGVQAIGLDLSFSMVRFARDKARELNLKGVFFLVGDSQRLPFRSAAVDCVVNYASLAHVPSPRRCIADMARIAAPHGRIIIQSINHFSFPMFYMKKGQGPLRHRTFNALRRYGGKWGKLRDDDCRLTSPPGLSATHLCDPERDVDSLDTNDVVSFYIRDLCDQHCDVLYYETFPNYRGWHDSLTRELTVFRQRRSPALRLKDAIWGLCQRIPGLRHMGTDLFLIAQPHTEGRTSAPLSARTEASR